MVKIIIAPYVKEIELILLFVIAKMEHMMMEFLLIANYANKIVNFVIKLHVFNAYQDIF